MTWQIVPLLKAVRGPQPDGVPDRPAVPYEASPTVTRRSWSRDVRDISAAFRTARSARDCMDHQRGHSA
ncbi:hypothetical protein [Streptomyces violaceusniger]|uniref:Uncharacterized protein n=1 Tax=Streptomyces violaceusniger (strain Tu 4113) TaxID=653045 RepID=G2PHW1_STRV4|nr:hypothetical protein [Streptomyces violaceusniger]AEM88912.1 hypothetical protein Strvi_0137 [Streptomyces violaceusniger Tu 4113]